MKFHFIKSDNPIAGALLSKMGYTEDERIQVKLEFFKILARLKLDREKITLLLGFFESYLQLSNEEEELFMEEAKKIDDANEVLELTISYEERGKEIGKKIGLEEGKEIGKKVGKKIGKELGKEEERREFALKMLRKNLDVDFIMELTMLSLDEIERLRKEYE